MPKRTPVEVTVTSIALCSGVDHSASLAAPPPNAVQPWASSARQIPSPSPSYFNILSRAQARSLHVLFSYKLTCSAQRESSNSLNPKWHQCLQNCLRRRLPVPPEQFPQRRYRSDKYDTPTPFIPCTTANSSATQASSRSISPELASSSLPISQLPESVKQFFMSVPTDGFPTPKKQKSQPWKKVWKGPQEPTDDGKLLVACPSICTYGMSLLGVTVNKKPEDQELIENLCYRK